MAPPALDLKSLSIIPNFDGNPNKLYRFINSSESILNHYFDKDNLANFQNVLLMNGILNKLEGRAEEVVAISGVDNWDSIKNTLLQNFGDQRDENCLNQDLVNLRQKPNETPYQFHERVMHLLNTICNHIDLRCAEIERRSKRDFFTKQALKTFMAGLRDPLGPIIRAMRPTTLAQAMQYITEEENIKYYQKSNQPNHSNVSIRKPITQHPQRFSMPQSNYQYSQFSHPSLSAQFNQPSTSSQFPRGPINVQRHPNPPSQRFPSNQQVFGKNTNQNVWRPNPKISQSKPTPMTVSTRNTTPHLRNQYQNNFFSNNSQKPKFVSEELFNTEFEEQANDETEYYDEQQTYEYFDTNENQTYSGTENFQDIPDQNEET